MKTSIINKIVVVFLILLMTTSFLLMIFMQFILVRYGERASLEYVEETMIYPLIIVCLLLIISAFILGRYLIGKVGKPLEVLIEEIGDINTVQIDKAALRIRENDEIGMLIDSFNGMKQQLSDYMRELEVQNRRLEAVFENIACSIVIVDEEYRIEMMNNKGGCFASKEPGSVLTGERCFEAFAGNEEACPNCPIKRMMPGAESEMTVEGKVFRIVYTAVRYGDGREVRLVVSRDKTLEYLTNREMIELDKLAQAGKVAAAITHEVKNPLAVIKSGVYYLEKLNQNGVSRYIFDKEFAETVELIKSSLDYAEKTTQNFLSFSKPGDGGTIQRQIELDSILDQVLMLYSHEMMKKRIRLVRLLNENQLEIELDIEIFKTMLLNLISNAVEAMETGGTITVRCDLTEEGCYRIEVEDTGKGISETELDEIFHLFHTTKNNRENAGVGLWIVQSEAEKAGGWVTARNNEEKGAAITVFIPRRGKDGKKERNSSD